MAVRSAVTAPARTTTKFDTAAAATTFLRKSRVRSLYRYDTSHDVIVYDGTTKLSGIHNILSQIAPIAPVYLSRAEVNAFSSDGSILAESDERINVSRTSVTAMCKSADPIEHGKAIDGDLRCYVMYGPDNYGRHCTSGAPDRCSAALVELFQERGWEPVASQMTIGDVSVGIGTQLDLLLMDTAKRQLALIELKATTRFDDAAACSFETGRTCLSQPFPAGIPSSALTHAQLQLAVQHRILLEQFAIGIGQSYVIRVGPVFSASERRLDVRVMIYRLEERFGTMLSDTVFVKQMAAMEDRANQKQKRPPRGIKRAGEGEPGTRGPKRQRLSVKRPPADDVRRALERIMDIVSGTIPKVEPDDEKDLFGHEDNGDDDDDYADYDF